MAYQIFDKPEQVIAGSGNTTAEILLNQGAQDYTQDNGW